MLITGLTVLSAVLGDYDLLRRNERKQALIHLIASSLCNHVYLIRGRMLWLEDSKHRSPDGSPKNDINLKCRNSFDTLYSFFYASWDAFAYQNGLGWYIQSRCRWHEQGRGLEIAILVAEFEENGRHFCLNGSDMFICGIWNLWYSEFFLQVCFRSFI